MFLLTLTAFGTGNIGAHSGIGDVFKVFVWGVFYHGPSTAALFLQNKYLTFYKHADDNPAKSFMKKYHCATA